MTTELNDFSVLIADDDAIAQRLMESVLGSIGIGSVALAEDGAVALACHDSMPGGVDFVLLDIDMPGMDGLANAAPVPGSTWSPTRSRGGGTV